MQSGTIQATNGWRKVTLRTLRKRSTERGLAQERSLFRGWGFIVARWEIRRNIEKMRKGNLGKEEVRKLA